MHRQASIKATLIAVAVLSAASVDARIAAPDHVIYGNATLFGDPAAPGQTIQLRLLATGQVIATYELGRDDRLGDQYALRIPMDTVEPRIDGRARPGDPVNIFIADVLAAETTVGGEGVAVRLDIDPQNLGSGPSLDITDVQIFEGNAGTTPVVFEVSLNTTSEDDVVLFWETADDNAAGGASCAAGIDYLSDDGSLTLSPGQMQGSITLLACGDTAIEPTETFRLMLNVVQGGVPARPEATATIIDDDDVPSLRVADVTVLEPAAGETTQAVFRPRLSQNSDFEARFDYTTEPVNAVPGVDYVAASGSVTIAAGDLEAEVPVTILNAPNATAPKSFFLRFSDPFNLVIDQDRALGVITDPAFRPAVEHEQDIVNDEDVIGLAGPTALALSPDGAHAYVTSEALDAVLVFRRNASNGHLTAIDSYNAAQPAFASALLDAPLDIKVSADGRHVYIASRADSAVVVMGRNESTGALSFIENQADGDAGADGANGPNAGLAGVRRLLLSADGRHVYAAGSEANAVAVFERDETTGALTFLEAEISGQNDAADDGGEVSAMSRPSGLAMAANGEQVYVASRFGDAVQVFQREVDEADSDFGKLSFVTAYRNGLAGIVGLDGAFDIGASADGAHVYVTAEAENAVVLFDRNADGTLAQRSVYRHDTVERPGLTGAQGLAISPDGLEFFATGFDDDSLTLFERAQQDNEDGDLAGNLTVRQTLFDDQGRILNMAGPTAITPSSDDQHLYVVANQDNAIVVLRRISLDVIFSDGFELP